MIEWKNIFYIQNKKPTAIRAMKMNDIQMQTEQQKSHTNANCQMNW